MRALLLAFLLLACPGAFAQGKPSSTAAAAERMRAAAERLLSSMPERERAKAARPFEDKDRVDWHYTPRSRNGVSFKDLDAAGREAGMRSSSWRCRRPGTRKSSTSSSSSWY